MFNNRRKEIERIKQLEELVDNLYDHLIATRQEVIKLLDFTNEQQLMINDLQKRHNELIQLLNGNIEES